MKILQVASFDGNVGDIFNHYGFRYKLSNLFADNELIEYKDIEMRMFYNNVD